MLRDPDHAARVSTRAAPATCRSLTINLCSRGRPDLLLDTVARTLPNIASERTVLMVSVDADDAATIAALKDLPKDERILPLILERKDSLGAKFNRCLTQKADVYLAMVDYAPQVTPGFDEKIIEAASLFPDGIGVVYNHLANPSFPSVNAITRGLVEKLGWFYPPYFPYWFIDHWIDDIAKLIDRISFADVQVDCSKRPGTQGRHEPGFWATVYDLMAGMRRRQAAETITDPKFLSPQWQKDILLRRMPLVEVPSRAINDGVRRAPQEPPSNEPRYQRIRDAALEEVDRIARTEYAGAEQDMILAWASRQRAKVAPVVVPKALHDDQEARLARAKTRSIFIATPIARHPVRQYSRALVQTTALLSQLGIRCFIQNICGGSNLPRGRNELVAHFLASDYTDMLCIDDDMGWTAADVVRLLASDQEVIGGVYAKKRHGPDEEPGKWTVVGLPHGEVRQDTMGAIEVDGLGTGFLKINRCVFERMIAVHPEWKRRGPPAMSEEVRRNYYQFFRFDPDDPDETGEDIAFCREHRKLGGSVWADPAIRLSHVGECEFGGDWTAILQKEPA